MVIELIAGFVTNALVLIADAGHMFLDSQHWDLPGGQRFCHKRAAMKNYPMDTIACKYWLRSLTDFRY